MAPLSAASASAPATATQTINLLLMAPPFQVRFVIGTFGRLPSGHSLSCCLSAVGVRVRATFAFVPCRHRADEVEDRNRPAELIGASECQLAKFVQRGRARAVAGDAAARRG